MQETLFHIVGRSNWAAAQALGYYEPDGFDAEGFIHLSLKHQILRPANLLYTGRDDLMLLVIDHAKLTAEVIFEPGSHGEAEHFPHLYGRMNLDAVEGVIDFPGEPDGSFVLPEALG